MAKYVVGKKHYAILEILKDGEERTTAYISKEIGSNYEGLSTHRYKLAATLNLMKDREFITKRNKEDPKDQHNYWKITSEGKETLADRTNKG